MAGTANQYPLLKNTVLTGIIRNFKTDLAQFTGAPWCPIVSARPGTDTIEWDIVTGAMGMTPAVYPDSPSPIKAHPPIAHKSFKTVQWREKFVLGETDLMYLRTPGTWDTPYGNQMIAERMADLNTRIETRLEYLRWTMLSGTITITYPDAKTQAVDYEVPSGNKPSFSTHWHDAANADPMVDIAALKVLFRGTPVVLGKLVMNQTTYNYIPVMTKVRNLIQYQFGYDLVRAGALVPMGAVSEALQGLPVEVNDSGYVADNGTFTPFLPDDKLLGLPASTPDKWCEFLSTTNMHHGGPTPQSGKFARPIWKLDDDPISVEVLGGVYGLPVMYHTDWHVYATVNS